ncbi:restriction endonuclease [Desulfocurvibacter africanus]|uniref:restriction endonuclease n=1 Tax=Desulfocurvibacter africanus TaxID=873 RepID=UPI00040A99C6|nr:restriction endonuclease [Desulfocurvibacter africanus]
MVTFGDIAQNVAVRVDPADAKTDVYVGLEHLDPSSLHLRQWGHPSDVTGQKLAFKKGDVFFGRRRAYQRKLAVAEFVGALQGKHARKGVFITTGTFAQGAVEYAAGIDSKVVLIDGKRLAELMIEFDVGVSTRATYQVKRIDSDYFNEE